MGAKNARLTGPFKGKSNLTFPTDNPSTFIHFFAAKLTTIYFVNHPSHHGFPEDAEIDGSCRFYNRQNLSEGFLSANAATDSC